MVNPLSRVAMKSILEKKDKVKGYNNNLLANKQVKTLSDFAKNKEQVASSSYKDSNDLVVDKQVKTLGDFTKNKEEVGTTRKKNSYTKETYSNNFNSKSISSRNSNIEADEKIKSLIKNVINRQVEIKSSNSIDSAITLGQAAEKIKQ